MDLPPKVTIINESPSELNNNILSSHRRNTKNDSNSGSDAQIGQLTSEKATESNAIQIPEISLPQGGEVPSKGIDEKFEVNCF